MIPTSMNRRWIGIAFFMSGIAALTYQVAWQRVLTQEIGSDSVSITLVVTAFMLWLGIGTEIARRILGTGLAARSLYIYAAIEFIVGIYGAFSIPLLRTANTWLASRGSPDNTYDLFINVLLLAPPIIGMGMTTPLIIHIVKNALSDLGRTVGTFYGLNVLGAASGALLSGFILIEALGLHGTALFAAALNIGIGVLFFRAARHWPMTLQKIERRTSREEFQVPRIRVYPAAILFGFGTLAIQILFIRILTNYFTMCPIVFPAILSAYLLLMAAGQWMGGKAADLWPQSLKLVIAGLCAAGAILTGAALLFPPGFAAVLGALRFTSFNGALVEHEYPYLLGEPNLIIMILFSLLLMVAVIPWAALFPVMLRLVTNRIEDAGEKFAKIYILYNVGNVLGSLMCGLYLLETYGTGNSAKIIIALVTLGALLIAARKISGKTAALPYALCALGLIGALSIPSAYYMKFALGNYSTAQVYEGRTGVVSVVPTQRFYTILDMNRTAAASAIKQEPQESDSYEAWRWNHTDIAAVDPNFRPKRILVIGIGHAYLIDALLDLPSVQDITLVEISKEMVEAVRDHTQTDTKRIFTDPRVHIVIADGRRYVKNALARGEHYDLVQIKINEPWHAGAGNLFTREFFALVKQLLNPGGYLGVRPLLGHLDDGLSVFGAAIWPGYYHIYFPRDPKPLPDRALITPDIAKAWRKIIPNGREGPRPKTLKVAYFTALPAELQVAANTDDRPTFEYSWLRQTLHFWRSPRVGLDSLDLAQYTRDLPVRYAK